MLQDHPTADQLQRFLRAGPKPPGSALNTQIVRHLLAGCSECHSRLEAIGWPVCRLDRLLYLSGGAPQNRLQAEAVLNYDQAFLKASECVSALLPSSHQPSLPPEILLEELEKLSLEQRFKEAKTERFAQPPTIRFLIQRSHGLRYQDTEGMLHLAQLAKDAAEACTEAAAGSTRRLADLQAEGWRQLGNAFRICGQLPQAENAFDRAQRYCAAGTGDPVLRACLLEQRASLSVFQRLFDQAVDLNSQAGQIYCELGELHKLAGTMIQQAIAWLYSGKPEQAIDVLNKSIPLIDRERDPYLLLAACHNLVQSYLDLDRPDQALSLYFECKDLYKEFTDALLLLRMSWQEGRLLRDLGYLEGAEQALIRAREGFLQRSLAYEAAVVSLDIAGVYVKMGQLEKLEQTISATIPIFQSLRIGRETLAAVLQICQVAQRQSEALELIRTLTNRLEQAGHP